ncbi:MAG: hypothetical protein WC420_04260 [Candidatus Paceibacterota bacterium]|jgi:hypothetical protein
MRKLNGISNDAIKRIAQVLDKEDNQDPVDEVPAEEPTVPQEPGFNIGDETPVGIIRNITQRNGEDIYFVGGNENGAFAQLMNKKDLEDKIYRFTKNEESRLRQEEEQAQAESERAERDDLKGFTDNMSPKTKALVERVLLMTGAEKEENSNKYYQQISYKGQVYRKKEYVEKLLEDGYFPATVQGKPAAQSEKGDYFLLQKTLYDYLSYLANLS